MQIEDMVSSRDHVRRSVDDRPPSLTMGFMRRRRSSASSRSISSSYGALHPGMRRPILGGEFFGSQRPPPVALQMMLERRKG